MADARDLVLLTNAQRALTEASTIDDVRELRARAAAVKTYAQKAQLGKQLVIDAAALRIRAERRLGQMLQKTSLANSAPGNQYTGSDGKRFPKVVQLKDLGITKRESSRSQRIAEVPGPAFEMYLAECNQTKREPTFAGLLRLLRPNPRTDGRRNNVRQFVPAIDNDSPWAIHGNAYSTILAVPPWPDCTPPGRPGLTTDQLCQLPVAGGCPQQAHLYLWTSSRFLIDAFDVLDAWGFVYQTSIVCVYEQSQPDVPWSDAHNSLLVGVRGDLGFQQSASRSWFRCERPAIGLVPDEIPELIEAASPGPYLLLFGRQDPPGDDWTPYTINPGEKVEYDAAP